MTIPSEIMNRLVAGRLTAAQVADWVVDSGAEIASLPVWLSAADDHGRRAAAALAIELQGPWH